MVRLRRLGQEAHDPYPSLVGVAEGHAWRWQSPVAWERDLGGGVGVDDNVNTRYTYLAVRQLDGDDEVVRRTSENSVWEMRVQ